MAVSVSTNALRVLFQAVEATLQLYAGSEVPPTELVQALLQRYGSTFRDWERYVFYSPVHYTRNLVDTTDAVEFIVLCWAPGQEARIHDHGASHCFMVALSGEVVEARYAVPGAEGPAGAAEAGPCPALRPLGETALVPGGPASYINNALAVHSVANRSKDTPAVTLHVYSPPIRCAKIFNVDDNTVTMRTPGFFSVYGRKTGKE